MTAPKAAKKDGRARSRGGAPVESSRNGDGGTHGGNGNGHGAEGRNGRPNEWNLRLYVAGDSPRSRAALRNLQALCERELKGKYKIEVIDLTARPELAKADQILAVPTLVRKIPEPMKRLIGDLSDTARALVALEIGSGVA